MDPKDVLDRILNEIETEAGMVARMRHDGYGNVVVDEDAQNEAFRSIMLLYLSKLVAKDEREHRIEGLISLDEYKRRSTARRRGKDDRGTGIACPECGEELQSTRTMLMSNPPKIPLVCPNCKFRTTVVAS